MWTEFGTLRQNDTPMTIKAPKPKPEIEFKYAGHLFSETGSSNNSVNSSPIWTKFGTLMQKDMPLTTKTSEWKPEIEFQYGGRLFSKTGSNNISAVDRDNSPKFDARIDFNFVR